MRTHPAARSGVLARAEVEGDAHVLLEGEMPDGTVQAVRAHPYQPSTGVRGYVVCGLLRRAGDLVGFAIFYTETEESVGFHRAGRPIFHGSHASPTTLSELVGDFCTQAGASGADTDPRPD
jgi:hypothetical protein